MGHSACNKVMYCAVMLLLVVYCNGQQKKHLKEEDYSQWHTLSTGLVSPDGQWATYGTTYPDGKDTLYLGKADGSQVYAFPKGHGAAMSTGGDWFACLVQDTLTLVVPSKGLREDIAGVQDFQLRGNILLYRPKLHAGKQLMVRNLESNRRFTIDSFLEFNATDTGDKVAFVTEGTDGQTVHVMETANGFKVTALLSDKACGFRGLQWDTVGSSVAFYSYDRKSGGNRTVCFYALGKKGSKVRMLPVDKLLQGKALANTKLYISDDGAKVFFDVAANAGGRKDEVGKSDVSVWNFSDKTVPPEVDYTTVRWHVWWVATGKILPVEDAKFPKAVLTGNQQYALLFDNARYLPLHDYMGYYRDIYLRDLGSGSTKLIIEKQQDEYRQALVSPAGKYIAYFKEEQWWLYDIALNRHTRIQGDRERQFKNAENDKPYEEPYGMAGWTENDHSLLLYDRNDLWQVDCRNGTAKRITSGRETKKIYRVYDDNIYTLIRDSFFGFTAKSYKANNLLLHAIDEETYGYEICHYSEKNGLRIVHKNNAILTSLIKATATDSYILSESSFAMPPRLVSIGRDTSKVLFQSNKQQDQYYWGKSRLLGYDANGKVGLKGALFYPAGYDATKSYPMVVFIYENKSNNLHRYVAPTLEVYDGFNVTNFTSNGYFVLMPDIAYTMNHPGQSALECVLAASEKALRTASIDRDKIAVMGHSFGGFETSYIVSRTDFFRTAVAGAAVTDLMSMYLTVDAYNKSNMERFDNGQFRNRYPFYSREFSAESPLENVQSINTPLLLWTGKQDRLVDPSHSIKMHTALWRLGKKSSLLMYPNEAHVIAEQEHQGDLYHKIMEWLDRYLKDGPAPLWSY